MPCADLPGALSKLLMNLGSSKSVKREAKWLERRVTSAHARERRFLAEGREGTKRQFILRKAVLAAGVFE